MTPQDSSGPPFDRRQLLGGAAAISAAALAGSASLAAEDRAPTIKNGRVQQSLAQWCYKKYWPLQDMCGVANRLGCTSIELVPVEDWPTLKEHGLICALASSHGFEKGMNNPRYHAMCHDKIRAAIDACAQFGFPNVITFTGFREDIPDDRGLENCVAGFKQVVGYAEQKKVNLCLEMLNSRVAEEMKGHPGYQGDHTDYCLEIIRQVGSDRLKLLFDIYHVQIMDGDVINRLRACADVIAHVHTAGNPGRGELDASQEINYPPIIQALVDAGYKGHVGQEFIPTRDPLAGLQEAVVLCDV